MTRSNSDFDWTDATIEKLRQLWGEGHATAEIGRRLGVSKSAAIGKAHRLNLPGRTSPIRSGGQAHTGGATKRVPAPKLTSLPLPGQVTPPVVAVEAPSLTVAPHLLPAEPPERSPPIAVARRTGATCCWPIGEPGRPGFRFCNAPASGRLPYCEEHAQTAYERRPKASPASAATR